jgi:Lhr-like helicases
MLITPESLEIDLDWAPRFREYYRNVKAVIVDEASRAAFFEEGSAAAASP